jgi:IclR family acetate operon transcriptional repressor
MTEVSSQERPSPQPGVVEKLTLILDVFAVGPDHLLLNEIASLSGLPRSTTFRLLSQLVDTRWLEHDQRGYRLGPRMRGMGRRAEGHLPLRSAAADALYALHMSTSAVVHLAVLDDGVIEMLDKVGGASSPTIPTTVGIRYQAEDAVAGRAMLAALSPERVDELLTEGRASGRLHERLHAIRRRRGLAITSEDMPWDLRGIGAPIIGPDGPVGAISVGLAGRSAQVERFAPMLARAVQQTSQRLFAQPAAAG